MKYKEKRHGSRKHWHIDFSDVIYICVHIHTYMYIYKLLLETSQFQKWENIPELYKKIKHRKKYNNMSYMNLSYYFPYPFIHLI